MTLDKSLKVRRGSNKARNVLTRGERIQRLKAADRWIDGDNPFSLPKVRVYKLAMKKKKKKKEEEEGAEGAAAAPAAAAPAGKGAAPAAKGAAPAAKGAAPKGGKK
jgi:small basic protein (TIGR04137 family)